LDCKAASRLIIRQLFGGISGGEKDELAEHLSRCAGCRTRLEGWHRVVGVLRGMKPDELPPQVAQVCEQAARHARAHRPRRMAPPADSRVARGVLYRTAVLLGVLALMICVNVGVLLLVGGRRESQPELGSVLSCAGKVEISYNGGRSWMPLGKSTPLLTGAFIRTDADGSLKIRTQDATWWLDGHTMLWFGGANEAGLIGGRCFVECTAGGEAPVSLRAERTRATCAEGSFVASVSRMRFFLTVISGRALLDSEGQPEVEVPEGHRAMLIQGILAEPVRQTDVRLATHWLYRFGYGGALEPLTKQVAALPLRPRLPVLPDTILLRKLALTVHFRGAVALAMLEAELENAGQKPWKGRLDAAELFWPRALCSATPEPLQLAPRALTRMQSCALVVLKPQGELYRLAFVPEAWSRQPLGVFSVEVEGTAAGGFDRVRCPTHPMDIECRKGRVRGSYQVRNLPSRLPLVIEAAFEEEMGCDVLVLPGGEGGLGHALVTCRGLFGPEELDEESGRYLFAFDAAAEYGPGGRVYAHELVESLVNLLPVRSTIAFMAYDGAVKRLPGAVGRHQVAQLEGMLAALWSVRAPEGAVAGPLIQQALRLAGGGEDTVLVHVTGRGDIEPPQAPEPVPGVRVLGIQVGAGEPGDGYRDLCRALGGVAAGAGRLHPQDAAATLMENLKWPPVEQARVELSGGGRVVGMLSRLPGFANAPLVALVRLGDAAELRGRFTATGPQGTARQAFALPVAEGRIPAPAAGCKLAAELARLVRHGVPLSGGRAPSEP